MDFAFLRNCEERPVDRLALFLDSTVMKYVRRGGVSMITHIFKAVGSSSELCDRCYAYLERAKKEKRTRIKRGSKEEKNSKYRRANS